MDKKKIFLIIIIVIVLTITSIVAVFISNQKNDVDIFEGLGDDKNVTINSEILELKTDLCFDIQSTITNYYKEVYLENYDFVYSVLNDNYKSNNNITKNNINEIINKENNGTYRVNKILYNNDDRVTYYFIEGYIVTDSIDIHDSKIIEEKYLIIKKNDYYVINPLDNNIDIENYAKNYEFKDIDINSKNTLIKSNLTENNKLKYYMANFLNLYIIDSKMAYELLGEETKKKYNSISEFEDSNIYFSTTVFAKNKKEVDEKTVYKIKNNNQETIEIIEEYPTKYKINF